ncbi:MAG: hypothetical protein CVU24_02105 [Betaproteobacteria bacterium HGW-Betaproteobacteria-18]|nr:MAG: hypothetical protein CVU24_02105 [Betaproteobacteria bacterium HGW-Betaproteobacteria-18]
MAGTKTRQLKMHAEIPSLAHPTHNSLTYWADSCEKILLVFFGLAPLFLVTIRSWSSALLIIGSLLSFIFLMRQKYGYIKDSEVISKYRSLIIVTLLLPVIAVVLSSVLRGKHVWADYDSPSRFLVAIAIFLFAIRKQVNIANFLQYTVPTSLVLTLLHQLFIHQPKLWGPDRMSTYFADPLVFGYTSLTFGLISLISVNLLTKDSRPVVALKLMGAAIGLYLSIMSGSRTGWLSVPIVIAIVLYKKEVFKAKGKHLWTFGFATALALGLFAFSSIVNQRLVLAFQEIMNYSWAGIAPEGSVGFRITFLRIAYDMFLSKPITGFGNTSHELTSLPQHIYTYASPESLRMAFTAGFHNEIVTNAIRYGVAGLVASAMLFVVPLFVMLRQMRSVSPVQRANALVGVVFTICVLISSMSTEVFDLKYTASFYALTIALLCASSIAAFDPSLSSRPTAGNSDQINI